MATVKAKSETSMLPLEIVTQITSLFPSLAQVRCDRETCQSTLAACCLVSRMWYCAAIAPLYENPYITGRNYEKFMATMCPSINAHVRKNGLANLVKTLDLHRLVYHGSKSKTARLLGRVKNQLEVFTAPQATFGVASLAALGKCKNLHHLDLSLVSEALDRSDLSRSFRNLEQLDFLALPRAGKIELVDFIQIIPPNLRECHMNCTIDSTRDTSEIGSVPPPNYTLKRLTLQGHAARAHASVFDRIPEYLPNLEYLAIGRLPSEITAIALIFGYLIFSNSSLQHLRLPVHFLNDTFFDQPIPGRSQELPSLHTIELDCGHLPALFEVNSICDSIWDAVTQGPYPNLRRVGLHESLDRSGTTGLSKDAEELSQLLKALAREDGDKAQITEDRAGVYTFIE